MKKLLQTTILLLATFLVSSSVFGKAFAANLKFDVPSVSVAAGDTFEVQVIVDTGGEDTNSIDAYIKYDKSVVAPDSVTNGTFYPTVLNDLTSENAYVAGLVDDPATSKSGSGTVATVKFKALAAGTTTLTYDCDPNVSATSKVIKNDIDSTNIITCSENGSTTVTVSGDGGTGGVDEATDSATGGVDSLPESGVFENVVKFAAPGILLFIIGLAVKLFI